MPSFEPLDLSQYHGQAGDLVLITAVDDIGLPSVEVELVGIDPVLEKGRAVETVARSGL